MNEGRPEILHVSDTALMVAACRAIETERPDGLLSDPFAARLAGERGMAIARGLPILPVLCFGIGMRSRFLDEMVMHAIGMEGVRSVLSLGAGLDSRPWRLDLPHGVRWVEVDFPAMLEYKSARLADSAPRCEVVQMAADLNDPAERRSLFQKTLTDDGSGRPGLIITEGLLMYLPGSTVEAMATEAGQAARNRLWLMNLESSVFAAMFRGDSDRAIENVRHPECLHGEEILDRLLRAGWIPVRQRTYMRDGASAPPERVKELQSLRPAGKAAPPPPPVTDISGVHLLRSRGGA